MWKVQVQVGFLIALLFDCQDIGLHRLSEGWNIILQQEKETRRTVWWAVYILDLGFRLDIDELYPSENVSLDEIMDVMTEKFQHLPRFPSLTEKVASKLSEILGQILQGLYTPQAKKHSAKHGSYAIVAYLDDALSKWRASLSPLLEISSAGKRSLSSEGHVPILSMSDPDDTTNTAHGEKPKLSFQSALTICTNAAIRIVEVSESMHYRDFLKIIHVTIKESLVKEDPIILLLHPLKMPNLNYKASSNASFIPTTTTGFDQQHFNNTNFNNPDAYSIRQFGINTNSLQQTGIRQPSVLDHSHHQNLGNTSLPMHSQSLSAEQLHHQQQQQQMHQKPTARPSPSTLFDVSDFSFPYFYGAPVLNNMNTILPTGLNYQQSIPVNMNAAAVTEDDLSSMFRNGPNNPFWNMPSSMEIDDWHAYLSPHAQKQQHK
ncbi:hypothetical protein BD770DRAFT_415773 [Pilaira anomala]|nr:hypothetical protein BD770DRAFT_415773 [Pilaira anomala]